jgi:hypothetical protein
MCLPDAPRPADEHQVNAPDSDPELKDVAARLALAIAELEYITAGGRVPSEKREALLGLVELWTKTLQRVHLELYPTGRWVGDEPEGK